MNVILFQPEIPPNTGNIIRLCANTGVRLHLIQPLGFTLDDGRLRRAGLDYHEFASVRKYADWNTFLCEHPSMKLWAISTRGQMNYSDADFHAGDGLLFGPETRGLPGELLSELSPNVLRIPMRGDSRSLNLSNAVAIVVFEALRQTGFENLA